MELQTDVWCEAWAPWWRARNQKWYLYTQSSQWHIFGFNSYHWWSKHLKRMAKNWARLVPIWVFRFHTFNTAIHTDTITFASTCSLSHHLSAWQNVLSIWGLTSFTAVKHSCQLLRILLLKKHLQLFSFWKKSVLTSDAIIENPKKLLPSQDDTDAHILPWAETFLCSGIQRLIVKSCFVLQSTFCVRLRYKSRHSTTQHETTSARVLGRGLSTPITYCSSSPFQDHDKRDLIQRRAKL